MSDPRKRVQRPEGDDADRMREIAYTYLLACTEKASEAIGCTGASFVILGVGIWANELAELDARAARQMFDALGDLFDPSASDRKKAHAERRRRAAVNKLLAAVNLAMSEAGGRA
jgi:hypothetical protein